MAGGAVLTGPYLLRGQNLNSRLNIAQIGCSGKGGSDAQWCATENLVALCDVNSTAVDNLKQYLPAANGYKDFRELFEKEKAIDAVDIAVPDHSHAIIAATAIKLGKHVYCQKPLTHDVYEARHVARSGPSIQSRHANGQSGQRVGWLAPRRGNGAGGVDRPGASRLTFGPIAPIWPQGLDRPAGTDPVPPKLDWDLWLGTAPARPFKDKWPDAQAADLAQVLRFSPNVYQPFNWRGWMDYGTGALGDMACHTVNWPFRALKLGYPTEIEASSSGHEAGDVSGQFAHPL